MTELIFQKGDIVRRVHPDAHSTQTLLKKAGFIQLSASDPPPKLVEGASPELAEGDEFDFLTEKQAAALREAGIETLKQLAETDAETLLAIDGIGPKAVEAILEATADLT